MRNNATALVNQHTELAAVGWIDFMFSTTLSNATSPTSTAFNTPSRMTGTAKATNSAPLVLT